MSRYIDADALKEMIHYTDDFYETPYVEWEDIVLAPTVDAVPVVYGEWIQMNGHKYCNVCGHKDSPILTNYCPNCGARMSDHIADVGKMVKKEQFGKSEQLNL